jgi:hypothetical protein
VLLLWPSHRAAQLARHALAGLGVCFALAASPLAGAQHGLEYEVKAAYLFHFVNFIEWSPETLGGPGEPFRVCVYGTNPFGKILDRTFAGEHVQGHPVQVKQAADESDLTLCRIVFVPIDEEGSRASVLKAAAGPGQLVIGELPGFIKAGAAINFFNAGGEVRFDINLAVIEGRRLKVSAKLLRLAHHIEKGKS